MLENIPYINYTYAIVERERPENSYRRYRTGEKINFTVKRFTPEGLLEETIREETIEREEGGGLYGKVLIFRDDVLKTTLPPPLRHLARTCYWGFREFPPRVDEKAAQLDHLSARIIHLVLPVLTDGKYHAPDSKGYVKLPTGYAQLLERVEGRSWKYVPQDETELIRDGQKELTKLAYQLGLEQVGQIHPNNPFGMANIWIDKGKGTLVWLDTMAAMEHKGPYQLFGFQKEIKDRFGEKKPTFNRIHTVGLLDFLRKPENRNKFSDNTYQEIERYISIYERVWQERIPVKHNFANLADASYELMADAGEAILKLPKHAILSAASPFRIILDQKYRDETALSGVRKAKEKGIISLVEEKQAERVIYEAENNPMKKRTMIGLYLFYFFVGRSSDIITASIFTNSLLSDDVFVGLIKAGVFDTIYAPLVRRLGTLAIAKSHKTDLSAAAAVASIPLIPGSAYSAVPAQIAVSSARRSELIWHYKVREQIANLSKLHPAGGYGTNPEAWLWQKLGKRIERLGSKTSK